MKNILINLFLEIIIKKIIFWRNIFYNLSRQALSFLKSLINN